MRDIQVRVNQHRAKLILTAIANEAQASDDPERQREYDELHAWLSWRYVKIYGQESAQESSLPRRVPLAEQISNDVDSGETMAQIIAQDWHAHR